MNLDNDLVNHRMTIENDNGVHRSIYFGEPGNCCAHFRINTWPGHLSISGDMGTFVFSRVEDMFTFFRGDGVNLHYWAEKVQAQSTFGAGVMRYEPDTLRATLQEYLKDHDDADTIMENVSPYLSSDYSAQEAIRRIYEHEGLSDFVTDLSEGCYKDYTPQYKWCCSAIVWAIKMYDAEKQIAA